MNSLAGDIQVSPNTIKNWLEIFERMYVLFVVRPYSRKINREVDFVVVKNNKPEELIEAKLNDTDIAGNLKYFSTVLEQPRLTQIVSGVYEPKNTGGVLLTDPFSYFSPYSAKPPASHGHGF